MKDTLAAIFPSQFTTIQREIRKQQLTDYFFITPKSIYQLVFKLYLSYFSIAVGCARANRRSLEQQQFTE